MPSPQTSRRTFIKGLTLASSAMAFPHIARSQYEGRKVAIACIGVGGKGFTDMEHASKGNEIVAICDVDLNNLAKAGAKFPNAKQYQDFRKMLDEVKEIEGVTVSTADHAHYPAAMHAIALGKHVCVQKPLTNTLWENRELHKAARKKKVITQMGNQGHTYEENRILKEWIAAGAIGKAKEAHVWTDRPIWPQGKVVTWKTDEVPPNLDWDLWLAATPDHPYSRDIHPFKWRGFIQWGAGALGDMGCHNMDPIFFALELGMPTSVEAEVEELTDIAWPRSGKITYRWKNHPVHGDFTLTWYEGKRADGTLLSPEGFPELGAAKLGRTGFFLRGAEGSILNVGDQAKKLTIHPENRSVDFLAKPVDKTLPRSVTPGNPQQEWVQSIREGKEYAFASNFDYAAPLTELCLVGGLAMRIGKPIEWDSEKLEVKGMPEAADLIKRPVYRKGWEYSSDKV